MVNRIADEGPVEFLMDRIFPTPGNILFLRNCQIVKYALLPIIRYPGL